MHQGKAWVVLEESYHFSYSKVISIQSPRKSERFIWEYMRQRYVDSFAHIEERFRYKRGEKCGFDHEFRPSNLMHCGHDPIYTGIFCSEIMYNDDHLVLFYKIRIDDKLEKSERKITIPDSNSA